MNQNKQAVPNTRLSERVPALKRYGIVLVAGSLVFMYMNKAIWEFQAQSARIIGLAVYGVLVAMLIAGVIILLSRSKAFVLQSLNVVIAVSVLVSLLSLLVSLNIVSLVLMVVVVGSMLQIKGHVKRAA